MCYTISWKNIVLFNMINLIKNIISNLINIVFLDKLFYIPFLMLFLINTFSQDVSDLEIQYSILNNSLVEAKNELDSLNQLLNKKADEIDNEKKKKKSEINIITKLMAESIIIASRVEDQQKKVNQIEGSLRFLKQSLQYKYSAIIDSLKRIENSTTDKESKSELKMMMLNFTQKRLYLSPDIPLLSFNPQKILDIDLTSISDSVEKKIYLEYLMTALTEVDSHLIKIKGLSDEIHEMIILQEKTESFIDELNLDGEINRYYTLNRDRTMSYEIAGDNVNITDSKATENDYIAANMALLKSYSVLLENLVIHRSLDFEKNPEIQSEWQSFTDSTRKNLSIDSYQALLLKVEKGLEEYKMIIKYKLENYKQRIHFKNKTDIKGYRLDIFFAERYV